MTKAINEFDSFPAPESGGFGNDADILPDLATIQERHPDWPELKLSFYFAQHNSAQDIEGLESHIKNADVLLYEGVGTDEIKKIRKDFYNNIVVEARHPLPNILYSEGWSSGVHLKNTIDAPMIRGLYGSHKVASSIDIGKNDEEMALGQRIVLLLDAEISRSAGKATR